MKKIALFPSCIIAAMSLLVSQPLVVRCPAATKEVIKFAALAPEGSAWIKEMRRLEKDLKAESGGVLKKIKIGQIHCAAFSGVGLGKILPMVRVLDLPFLFRNKTEIDRVHESLREYFKPAFRKKGFEFLAWAEVGNVHIFSKVPIRKVTDLSRLKVWTWTGDPVAKATFTRMGVNPIPLAVTDVTTAPSPGCAGPSVAPL
ncbi:MAG: TRAP transporter substrate-binding protein DctP [Deltaproteobacteria bacterium]|nr:TRAP transporter substrate-binding protein DctP [Deltaproteobacteria bacterium]